MKSFSVRAGERAEESDQADEDKEGRGQNPGGTEKTGGGGEEEETGGGDGEEACGGGDEEKGRRGENEEGGGGEGG